MSRSDDDPERGPANPVAPGTEPFVAKQQRPFGILSTFGWAAAALAAAILSATLVMCVFVFVFDFTYDETVTDPLSDGRTMAVIGTALAVATLLFFSVIVAACRRSGWRAAEYLGLMRPKGRWLLGGLAAFLLPVLFSLVAARFGPLATDDPPVGTALASLSFFIEAVILAPIAEELIFRGFLFRGLAASRLGVGGAIVITSILWAAGHTDRTWLGYVDLLPAGIALGWLRWRSDSTIPAFSVHGLHNIVSVVFVFGWGTPR